jgi:hypothetical protein
MSAKAAREYPKSENCAGSRAFFTCPVQQLQYGPPRRGELNRVSGMGMRVAIAADVAPVFG